MPYCEDLGLLGAALVALSSPCCSAGGGGSQWHGGRWSCASRSLPRRRPPGRRRRRSSLTAPSWPQPPPVGGHRRHSAPYAIAPPPQGALGARPLDTVLELSEKYQKCFDPLQYYVAGFLKFLCLPKYHFELEYLPTTKDAANSEGKVLEDQEKIDMSDLYLCANLEEKRVVKKGRFLCIHSCRTVQSLSSQVVAPKAEHVDDSLDLLLVNGSGRMRLLRLFMCLQFGWHLSLPYVEYVKVKAVKVRSGINTHNGCDIDGELLCVKGQVLCSLLPK